MEKELKFAVDEIRHINREDYDDADYMIAKIKFLSTRPNSHEIDISEDVLKEFSNTVLGKWVTAEVLLGDCTTHTGKQVICGIVPKEQDVEFIEADDGYIDAYVDCIISKRYAKQYCNVFSEDDDVRAVSIEASFEMEDEHIAKSFDIKTITTLGKRVKPSVPGADITITRFSEQDAEEYYRMSHQDSLSNLRKFAEERKAYMANEKYVDHPINTSKDAVYDGEWDGDKAKKNLVKEKDYKSLAPKVCLKLEDGWEDREITKLGYPVMGLYDGEWRYSSKAIASAQAYAEQNDETEVLNKIKKIKKSLGLEDSSDGKEEKMAKEIEFAAVDIGDMWGRLWSEIDEGRHWEYGIVGVFEEDNKKFAVLRDREGKLYRLDFSLTEDGLTVADEVIEVKQEFTETDNMKKFAEPENVADYRFAEDDGKEKKMSEDEMMAKIAELEKDIEERDHIIMDKDAELAGLREYKATMMAKENAAMVDCIMEDVKPYVTEAQFSEFKAEGLSCDAESIDAWANKVKAMCFSEVKKNVKKDDSGVMRFAMPTNHRQEAESADVWERLKNKY